MKPLLKFFAFLVGLAVFWQTMQLIGRIFPDGALGGMSAVVLSMLLAVVAYVLCLALITRLVFGKVNLD